MQLILTWLVLCTLSFGSETWSFPLTDCKVELKTNVLKTLHQIFFRHLETSDDKDSRRISPPPVESLTSVWAPSCPAASGIPLLMPHPCNCRSMFVCLGGKPKEYFCPRSRVFNTTYQGCVKKTSCPKVNSEEIQAFKSCPSDGSELLFPHPTDCSMYYQCVHGLGLPRPCPKGLHFNPDRQICDWPQDANCKAQFFLVEL